MAGAPAELKGGYPFQSFHAGRRSTWSTARRCSPARSTGPCASSRSSPGWRGGAGASDPPQYEPNTRHHKGLIGYEGERKPAFFLVRDRYRATPLYP